MTTSYPRIVDLFCGCGGFGLGAELAGCHSFAAIDIEPILQSAYRLNFPNTRAIQADIGEIDKDAWAFILGDQQIDGVIGGPPCQGFSRIGKREKGDPRNTLIGHFFRHVAILQPRFFVMENVEGLLDTGNIENLQAAIDTVSNRYTIVGPVIINALRYGAPTARRRVVVIGFDRSYVDELSPADLEQGNTDTPVTVVNAIGDLPSPVADQKGEFGWAHYPDRTVGPDAAPAYARMMRKSPIATLGWPEAVERLKKGQSSGHFNTVHTPAVVKRFAETGNGKTEPVSRYPRLAWDGHCPTLRAGTGADRGGFQAMRPIHPSEPRVITVREAARLQGFPDWFVFHPTKWHSFRMIGNSVSPLVGQGILTTIIQKMYGGIAPLRVRA
ncbi:DNA (cytosine-5-)-methyltransferase [Paramagnetospirillum kuznetsovii]|uniref:Cytosine-specific methyltransferase n=2 Tax=Paramagnetospirillum kuznetsovii TaxID=2053833 RepID=A0A364NXW6_9PROT|nr:DNA (cytosine-5-)-methyltransferase [Paramagnetospirillum kuznetsovii]